VGGALFAAVMTVGLASVALAQTDVTTTRITGTVKDVDGGVLPGATVEARAKTPGSHSRPSRTARASTAS